MLNTFQYATVAITPSLDQKTVGSSVMSLFEDHYYCNRNRTIISYQVYAKVYLRGRFATNRPKRDTIPKRRAIDLRMLMTDPKLREKVLRVTLKKLGSLITGSNATDMAASLA